VVSRHAKGSRATGTAMLETVIVLPLLLLVLFGIVELSVVLGRWQALSNAAREGARLAIVFRTGCDSPAVEAEVQLRVENYAEALGITPVEVEVAGECEARGTTSTVTVRSTYTFRVLPGFARGLAPSLELVTSSVMRNEGSG
jgi:Flp pilus assembly protein TadG